MVKDNKIKQIKQYSSLAKMALRTFKYIFEDKEKILEYFIILVEEMGEVLTMKTMYL